MVRVRERGPICMLGEVFDGASSFTLGIVRRHLWDAYQKAEAAVKRHGGAGGRLEARDGLTGMIRVIDAELRPRDIAVNEFARTIGGDDE